MPRKQLPMTHLRNIAQREREIARDDMERKLDKMHVSKMSRSMMGTLVAFAFDDEQALRAACWLLGHCALQLGKPKDIILTQAGLAYDLVHADQGEAPVKASSIVGPDGGAVQ